jgi:hypothetical protein
LTGYWGRPTPPAYVGVSPTAHPPLPSRSSAMRGHLLILG